MLILIVLPGFSSMVPVARMAVRNLLPDGPRIDDAVLIVSEFTTSSVRHSISRGGQFELSLDITPGRLRIEVRDGGPFGYPPPAPLAAPTFPTQPWTTLYEEDQHRDRAAEVEEYGLGLALINAASDKWGTSRYPDHAVWWAELAWPTSASTIPASSAPAPTASSSPASTAGSAPVSISAPASASALTSAPAPGTAPTSGPITALNSGSDLEAALVSGVAPATRPDPASTAKTGPHASPAGRPGPDSASTAAPNPRPNDTSDA